jgi:nucleotide-binding universal stress UspA family protein
VPHRPILVADDIENQTDSGKKRSQAVREASSSLASQLKTGINLLYVEDINAFPVKFFGSDSRRLQDWHSKHQRKLEELCKNFPVPARYLLKSGSPPDQIQKALRSKSPPEIVVVGTRSRKGLQHLLLGRVAEEVIRQCKRPVMAIGPSAQEKNQNFTDQKTLKILVATDLRKNSRGAEQFALSLAKRMGAKVLLLHGLWDKFRVVREYELAHGMVLANLKEMLVEVQREASESLQQKVSTFNKRGVYCAYKLEEKEVTPATAILKEAEQGHSIIVLGTHGRNVLLSGFFGSTVRETILKAKIPVITVHSGR